MFFIKLSFERFQVIVNSVPEELIHHTIERPPLANEADCRGIRRCEDRFFRSGVLLDQRIKSVKDSRSRQRSPESGCVQFAARQQEDLDSWQTDRLRRYANAAECS